MKTLHAPTKECIQKDLLTIAHTIVRQRGRRLSWLSFAKRTLHGYAFLKHTSNNWEVWEEIIQKTKKLHPDYAFSLLAEWASELLNQDAKTLNSLSFS